MTAKIKKAPAEFKTHKDERLLGLISAFKSGRPMDRNNYCNPEGTPPFSTDTYDRDMVELRKLAIALKSPYLNLIDKDHHLHHNDCFDFPDITDNEYLLFTLLHQIGSGIFRQDENHPAFIAIRNTLNLGFCQEEQSPYIELLDHIAYRCSESQRDNDPLSKIIYILQAIKERKILKCEYQKPQVKESKSILLKPARLFFYNGSWYVVGEEDRSEKVKQYKVSRMSKIVLTETKYSINTKKVNKVLNKLDSSFGIHFDPQAEVQIACIKFDSEVKDLMQDLVWFDKQENNEKVADGVIFKVPYTASRELLGRILRYGCHAEVLEPESLRVEWLGEVRKMSDRFLTL